MSSNNVNQILSRNLNILEAKTPLFVNLKHDGFIQEYRNLYTKAAVTCYNTNFEDYSSHKLNKNIKSVFSAHYKTDNAHDLIIIAFPKNKAELNFTLNMIAQTATPHSNIIIVGENKSGIKSLNKVAEKTLVNCKKYDSARHCLLYIAQLSPDIPQFTLEDWYDYYQIEINNIQIKVAILPGVFSQKGLDKGTRVLLEHLPMIKTGNMLDFGCGAGVIACFIGKKHPEVKLNLLDVNALALDSSTKTLALNNLTGDVFASNSLSNIKNKYDVVISNPPFHQGLSTNYSATESFLKGIKKHLHTNGQVFVVANSFLKYAPIMEETIGKTTRLLSQQGFIIYKCET